MSGEVTQQMRDEEPFRWCVFCDVDCDVAEHTEACPVTTGMYPVRPTDLGHECVHCSGRTPGMSCAGCGRAFAVGDLYMHVGLGESSPAPGLAGAPTMLIVCVDCKAAHGLRALNPEAAARVDEIVDDWS